MPDICTQESDKEIILSGQDKIDLAATIRKDQLRREIDLLRQVAKLIHRKKKSRRRKKGKRKKSDDEKTTTSLTLQIEKSSTYSLSSHESKTELNSKTRTIIDDTSMEFPPYISIKINKPNHDPNTTRETLLQVKLGSLEKSFEKEKQKNKTLDLTVKSLRNILDDTKRIHEQELRSLEESHKTVLGTQKSSLAYLQEKNESLILELENTKIYQDTVCFNRDSLDKEYRALREAHDKSQEEAHSQIESLYENVINPLKNDLKVKNSLVDELTDKLSMTKITLDELRGRNKASSDDLTALAAELEETKLDLESLQKDYEKMKNFHQKECPRAPVKSSKGSRKELKNEESNSYPSKKDISYALGMYNWKVINLEVIVNNALNFYFNVPSGNIEFIKKHTIHIHPIHDNDQKCWYASLNVRGQTWDPSLPDAEFVLKGDYVGRRNGRLVYRSIESARDALMFYVLRDIDPRGQWVDSFLAEHEESCMLRKDTSRKGTRWLALIKKADQIYLVDVQNVGKIRKPFKISDRRLNQSC